MHFLRAASTAFVLATTSQNAGRCLSVLRSVQSLASTTVTELTKSTEKYDALITWLKSQGAEINDKIILKPSTIGGGFGAFVTDVVEAEELLLTIPRTACITLDAALQDEACGKSFQRLMEKAGPGGVTVAMAGFMAKEWLITLEDMQNNNSNEKDDNKKKSGSAFGPYLRTLPWARGVNNQEHILYWTKDEIETNLKGSMCYPEATAIREEVSLAIRVLNGIVSKTVREYRGEEVEGGFKWPWEPRIEINTEILEGLPEAVKGAFVCLLTRAFEDGDDDAEKLVPLLDMLQHSNEPTISHVMRKSDGTVEVRARKCLQPGEELFNQYRSELEETMPYHRFFTRYGFVPGIEENILNLFEDKSSIFFAQKAEV